MIKSEKERAGESERERVKARERVGESERMRQRDSERDESINDAPNIILNQLVS